VIDADAFVSVQKLKNHAFMGVTLCLKNLFGLMPTEPHGRTRAYYHHLVRMPYMLADIGRIFDPTLNIIDGLISQGYEVYVVGVTAYSTLGWFDDPVLSTFMRYSEDQSAALIFHELAHQILYVKGDTVFNESFATAVEQEGLKRWQAEIQASHLFRDYLRNYRRQQQFVQLIMDYRRMLETLYQSDASTLDKREQKTFIFSELREEFVRLKTRRNGLSAYDDWMNSSLNNAKIASVAAYHDFVPAFQKMLVVKDGNLNQFYKACRELAQMTKDERHRILNSYLEN